MWGQEDPESCQLFSEGIIRDLILAGKDPAFSSSHALVPAWYTLAPEDPCATLWPNLCKVQPEVQGGLGAGWFQPAFLIVLFQSKCSTNSRFGHGVGGLGIQLEKGISAVWRIQIKWTEGGPADGNYIYPGLPCPLLDGVFLCSRLWVLLERGSRPRGLGPALERALF